MDHEEELLARMDERLKHLEAMVAQLVHRAEFMPVKMIAFGLAGLLLSSLVAAIVAQVLK